MAKLTRIYDTEVTSQVSKLEVQYSNTAESIFSKYESKAFYKMFEKLTRVISDFKCL